MREYLRQAVSDGHLRLIDLHAALFLEKLAGGEQPELLLAAALTSRAVGDGHVCLPLAQAGSLAGELCSGTMSDPGRWEKNLLASSVVGRPGDTAPLILDLEDRLYLYRFFMYEEQIAGDLLRRAAVTAEIDFSPARSLLLRLFPETGTTDWQQMAAALALIKRFVVISGGPGTGKTYTVARILALLQALHANDLRIALAAPTGKAAARLQESVRTAKASMEADLSKSVPDQAQTLHRLLGVMPGSGALGHNRENRLHLDLLVLDEASMIDVPLMASLLAALPEQARLILLGDRDQLASVEAGSLFADLCGHMDYLWSADICNRLQQLTGSRCKPAESAAPMADCVALLQTSYRFRTESGIGSLARAVNSGKTDRVKDIFKQKYDDLNLVQPSSGDLHQWLQDQVIARFSKIHSASSAGDALNRLARFRILCALRKGPFGAEGINRLTEQALLKAGLIPGGEEWYRGKPVMIRRNDYTLQLFNGDTGILWPDEQGNLQAWFMRPDNSLHPVAPARLPEHLCAYSITVHKAQGSEFDEVLLLLPGDDVRVLSRELLYTAITRARSKLTIIGDFQILQRAMQRRATRYSGLGDRLWGKMTKFDTFTVPGRPVDS